TQQSGSKKIKKNSQLKKHIESPLAPINKAIVVDVDVCMYFIYILHNDDDNGNKRKRNMLA
ncbi:hypothetical protein DERF_010378, partial [Dermatophagoides farinae]